MEGEEEGGKVYRPDTPAPHNCHRSAVLFVQRTLGSSLKIIHAGNGLWFFKANVMTMLCKWQTDHVSRK